MAAPKRTGWVKWVVLLLVVAAAGAGWRWYAERDDDDVEYRTATIAHGDLTQSVTANGQINPVKNVQVGSQISGIIKDLYVDFNSPVTNGQVIAQIDPSTYDQNLGVAQADLANGKAMLEYAEINNRRTKELRASELVAASDYDKTLADLHQAEAVLKMREAAVNKARVDLERTTIYAPIDGVVISRNVDVGQTVAASFTAPTLFIIANDLAKMQIEAAVSEADVGAVEVGQNVEFSVDAFPTRTFYGEVKQVRYAAATNQNVVTYTTIVEVSNPDLKLRPGMTATASIISAKRSGVLKIANSALRFRPTETVAKGTNAPRRDPASTEARPPGQGPGQMASRGGVGPGAGGAGGAGGGGNREQFRQRMQNMSPEERAAMRARFGNREGARPGQESPIKTVYVMDKTTTTNGKPILKPMTIKVGITDGKDTEVLEGLNEGDVVVTGVNTPTVAANMPGGRPPGGSPFGGPFGGGFRPR
jgi:HlyD family secretion protein